MFRRIILLLTIMTMTSCAASVYYQIATISSPQMSVSDDGTFSYNENDLTIDYDFWSDHGKVGFIITNNTNEDIYIDLSRSFLIVNGMTFDYCRNRTYKSKTSGIVNNLSSEKGTTADNRKSMTYVLDKDATSPDRYNYNIETTEKEGVWIPAHAARYFCEFYLLQDTYRRCGLPLNPSRKENASIDFNEKDTPYVFENRLMIMVNGQEQRLINYFYINNITNLHESEAIEQGYMRDCFGHPTEEKFKRCKYQAPNRFYINYEYGGKLSADSNDRTNNSNSESKERSTKSKTTRIFRDGIYGE